MQYTQLGRSGLYVSRLALGTWRLQRTPADERSALVNAALDDGINLIDMAPGYGDGEAETTIGTIIAERGNREGVLLATKCSGPKPREPNGFLCTRRNIVASCERALRNLRTDYIDLLQVHCAEPQVPIDETLMALDDLVRAGKVRAVGASNFKGWQLVEAMWAAKENRCCRFTSDQSEYHLLDRRLEAMNFPAMQSYGMKELVYSPLAQGILTGKYHQGGGNVDGLYAEMSREKKEDLFERKLRGPIEQLIALADARGHSAAQLALAFVLDQPAVAAPIIAPRTLAQLEENLGSLAVSVDDELRAGFNAINPPGDRLHGNKLNLYNHGPTTRWI